MVTTPNNTTGDRYWYQATVTAVYDGDTITLDIDLGLSITINDVKLRLSGINAPEKRGDTYRDGIMSRDYLRQLILGKRVLINTIKTKRGSDQRGKYGRLLAAVYIDGENINDRMVTNGMATPYSL